MNTVYRFLHVLVLLIAASCNRLIGSSINLFLRPAPAAVQRDVAAKLERLHTKGPSQIGRKMLKNGFERLLPTTSGLIALYGGYVDYSDPDGNITFPLLHKKKKLFLVITPEITLTPIHGHTFSHKNIVEGKEVKRYLFRRKVDAHRIPFWKVSEKKPPKDGVISPLSLVLLTKPKNIVVPTGDFMATDQINMILPHIYVVGNLANEKALLDFMDIRRYFEQITRESKEVTEQVKQRLIMNN